MLLLFGATRVFPTAGSKEAGVAALKAFLRQGPPLSREALPGAKSPSWDAVRGSYPDSCRKLCRAQPLDVWPQGQ